MSAPVDAIVFGRFRLDPARRALSVDGRAVALSSRAFDILQLLLLHRDRVVAKDEIIRVVWRGMVVEENNLAVQISALRRALAEAGETTTLIATVPGQGYRFVGVIGEAPAGPVVPALPIPLPIPPGPLAAPPRRWQVFLAVGAAAVGVAAAVVLWRRSAYHPPEPPRLSIAVLPFRNLGDSRSDDYLADAISDDLTTDLAHIPDSVVIARESSDSFRGRAVPTADIGRALNVRYLLEGSLRGADGEYSINAQLIEAATGGHLWAQRFSVPREKINETQAAIVNRLASALNVTLVDVESRRLSRDHANPDAVDLLLRARSILDRSDTLAAMVEAQQLLEQALALEPNDAEVLSALGALLVRKTGGFEYDDKSADVQHARDVVNRALSVAPRSTAALVEKGFLLARDHNCADAVPIFQRVIALDPSNLRAHIGHSRCQCQLGKFEEARKEAWTLLRLDPDGSRTKLFYYYVGFDELMLGNAAAALVALRQAQAADPDPPAGTDELGRIEWGRLLTIVAMWQTKDREHAQAGFDQYNRLWPRRTIWRISSQLSRAETRVPGFAAFVSTLQEFGMPRFADENEPAPAKAVHQLDPLPATTEPPTLNTELVRRQIAAGRTVIIDLGSGACALPGALLVDPDNVAARAPDGWLRFLQPFIVSQTPIVAMGDGAYSSHSRALATFLFKNAVPHVFWYRGGEEAWAANNLRCQDIRPQ